MKQQIQKINLGYTPRAHQNIVHKNRKRFNVLLCHRRFGKSHLSIMEMVHGGLECALKFPQYGYIAPTYTQAEKVAWTILKNYLVNVPGVEFNESKLRAIVPRPHMGDKITFFLFGADNPDSLRGMYFDGVLFDEYASMNPEIWTKIVRLALSDREGWAIFIGTPNGVNHFYEIYEYAKKNPAEWYVATFKASETGIIPRSELESARATMTEEEYEQEMECSFSAALVGAYFGKEMERAEKEGRVTNVPHEPAVPVSTYWDLGIADTTVIWFIQEVGKEAHVIDHLEDSGQSLDFYAQALQKKGYFYEEHVLPHDAAARDLSSGKSREEVLRRLGLRTRILPRHNVQDGIDAARRIISKCWFDAVKCERGIKCLKNYEKRWDAKNKIFSSSPHHNWASHSADAFRTYAMGSRTSGHRVKWDDLPREADNSYDIFGTKK